MTNLKLLIRFFTNAVPNLKIIPSDHFETTIQYETENPVQNEINQFKNHPSIKVIISKINPNKRFSFCPVHAPPLSYLSQSWNSKTN